MNKHRKGLYIISGLFYLFFSGALALYPTKMTVGATISMIAGAVLTLAAAVSSFILAAQSGKNPKDSAVRTVVMPICFVGFAVISLTEFTLQTPKELQYFMLVLGMLEATKRMAIENKTEYGKERKELLKEKTPKEYTPV